MAFRERNLTKKQCGMLKIYLLCFLFFLFFFFFFPRLFIRWCILNAVSCVGCFCRSFFLSKESGDLYYWKTRWAHRSPWTQRSLCTTVLKCKREAGLTVVFMGWSTPTQPLSPLKSLSRHWLLISCRPSLRVEYLQQYLTFHPFVLLTSFPVNLRHPL